MTLTEVSVEDKRLVCKNNGGVKYWRENHINILKDWKMRCFTQMWLQGTSSLYYRNISQSLSYPIIILAAVSGATLFGVNQWYVKYIVSFMNVISTILTAMIRQIKPGELRENYKQTERKYNRLIRKIQTIIELPNDMKSSPDKVLEGIGIEIDGLMAAQLPPPVHVNDLFERRFGILHKIIFGNDIIKMVKKNAEHTMRANEIHTEIEINV